MRCMLLGARWLQRTEFASGARTVRNIPSLLATSGGSGGHSSGEAACARSCAVAAHAVVVARCAGGTTPTRLSEHRAPEQACSEVTAFGCAPALETPEESLAVETDDEEQVAGARSCGIAPPPQAAPHVAARGLLLVW